ncbi:mutS like protein [Cavenderia fasciculata]|uniref:MutS like protein n=1 Tax=Cavenderia fasciculata TaxID=261658 RepID=F4PJF4_CACFS|nr:mutS like protein [Cavenderia fasciculata]EGG24440.1 mutS like protein [Cavenderia fasciculata]|eukprot:XP_004362291.1 mutS like protein [Cavenderia fasciculata]
MSNTQQNDSTNHEFTPTITTTTTSSRSPPDILEKFRYHRQGSSLMMHHHQKREKENDDIDLDQLDDDDDNHNKCYQSPPIPYYCPPKSSKPPQQPPSSSFKPLSSQSTNTLSSIPKSTTPNQLYSSSYSSSSSFKTPIAGNSLSSSKQQQIPKTNQSSSSSSILATKSNLKTPTTTTTTASTTTGMIVALTENKNREIGLAAYNPINGSIELGQFCDSQTYVHLYTKIYIFNASTILTPPISNESEMIKMITLKFSNLMPTTIPRKLFNENNGLLLLKQYGLPNCMTLLEKQLHSKYLALASFNALVQYLDGNDVSFSNNCLNILFSGSERTMQIDAETIKILELIRNNLDGSRNATLFSSINFCKTSQGERLLISNITQPLTDLETIKMRQNCIKFILKNEKQFFAIIPILGKIGDLDRMLVKFTQKIDSRKLGIKAIQSNIHNIIQFKNSLELIPRLANILSILNDPLLSAICKNLSNKTIQSSMEETFKYINEHPPPASITNTINQGKSTIANTIVSSIKQGVNGLLDVCKKTYYESLQDMNKLTTYYQEEYNLNGLKLQHSTSKGFFFSVPCKNKDLLHLPNIFFSQTFKNARCSFLSNDLLSLSRRNKEVLEEIILMTSISVEKLTNFYREFLSDLFNVSQSIALLDLLMSLSTYVTFNDQCVCPEVYNKGPLAIKKGYHPTLLALASSKKNQDNRRHNHPIPNDTIINETSNCQIIHGPNMSGKTTYIQQIALLTVMAHLGGYVPCQYMAVPVTEKIVSRIGTSDNMQGNASTFMTEMKEIAYILESANENSLVIIDELGRGTSNTDGSSIAWSICESISRIQCYTLFITHYKELLSLCHFYGNIKNFHLNLKYTYQITEGISNNTSYGIDIAEMASIDNQICQKARLIRSQLDSYLSTPPHPSQPTTPFVQQQQPQSTNFELE